MSGGRGQKITGLGGEKKKKKDLPYQLCDRACDWCNWSGDFRRAAHEQEDGDDAMRKLTRIIVHITSSGSDIEAQRCYVHNLVTSERVTILFVCSHVRDIGTGGHIHNTHTHTQPRWSSRTRTTLGREERERGHKHMVRQHTTRGHVFEKKEMLP